MRIEDLQYHAPETLDRACELLGTIEGGARVVAGGTDVLADLKQGLLTAPALVSLARIDDLRRLELDEENRLRIGPLVTANQLARSPLVRAQLPALADAAGAMAGNPIRNLATVGGNVCSAVPSADLPPSLLVAEAEARLVKAGGERLLPLRELFLGPRETALEPGEILAELRLPPRVADAQVGSAYERFQLRRASALAVVGVAASLTLDPSDGRIAEAAVAVGAAAPTPLVIDEAAEALKGKAPIKELFERAGGIVSKACSPIDDLRASADYRRELAAVLTARALQRAAERARP